MVTKLLLSRSFQGELPFTLNIPDGIYSVLLSTENYAIEVQQNRIAVADTAKSIIVATPQHLAHKFSDRWESLYKHELRTMVFHRDSIEIDAEALPTLDDEALFQAAQSRLMREDHSFGGGAQLLQEQARKYLEHLTETDRSEFVFDSQIRNASETLFPRNTESFLLAVNTLVRLYMATFNDNFVHEVSEGAFGNTVLSGIYEMTLVNDQLLGTCRHAGGYVPLVLRRQWWEHPAAEVAEFHKKLSSSPQPDPVRLLFVRARSFIIRGANRSAIIEAAAAFDLCLLRKIREGFNKQGKTDSEIDSLLRQQDNRRLDTRAKKVLRQSVGSSAAELAPALWQRFIDYRARRGSVAHAAHEPDAAETKAAVGDMEQLADAIDKL